MDDSFPLIEAVYVKTGLTRRDPAPIVGVSEAQEQYAQKVRRQIVRAELCRAEQALRRAEGLTSHVAHRHWVFRGVLHNAVARAVQNQGRASFLLDKLPRDETFRYFLRHWVGGATPNEVNLMLGDHEIGDHEPLEKALADGHGQLLIDWLEKMLQADDEG